MTKQELEEFEKQQKSLLGNIGEEMDLSMAPGERWDSNLKSKEELNENFDQAAANLLDNYLKSLYGKEFDRDKMLAYLQFKKDALLDKNSNAARALLNDKDAQARLKELQRQKFEDYLKGRRNNLTKEELEELEKQKESLLGNIGGEEYDLTMAPDFLWRPETAKSLSPSEINTKYDELAADLLKDHLKRLYGKDYKKDKMAAYLKFRMEALKDKNSEAYKLLNDAEQHKDLHEKLKKLQKAKFEEYLATKKGKGLSGKELENAKKGENMLLVGVGEDLPLPLVTSNDFESFRRLIEIKHVAIASLMKKERSASSGSSTPGELTNPELEQIINQTKVSTKLYGDKLNNFKKLLIKAKAKSIWPNIPIPAGLFLGSKLLQEIDNFSENGNVTEEPLKEYIEEEYNVFSNDLDLKKENVVKVNCAWQVLQITLLQEQLKFVNAVQNNAHSENQSKQSEESRHTREAILANIGTRIRYLQGFQFGNPISDNDIQRYLLSFQADQKLEIEFELCERAPHLKIIEQGVRLVPDEMVRYLQEISSSDASGTPKKTKEQVLEDIKVIVSVLVYQYRAHYQERRSLLATLTDPNSSKLRDQIKLMSFSGRQERLTKIHNTAQQVENSFGAGGFNTVRQLIEMSNTLITKQLNGPSIDNDKLLQYEDIFDEAGALAFLQCKQYLKSLNLPNSEQDIVTWLLSELRNDEDRKRAQLLCNLTREGASNELIKKISAIFKLRYEKPLIPNAYSVLCRVRLPKLEDFYLIRAAALPYELAKFHIYGPDQATVEKLRKHEAKIANFPDYSDLEVQAVYDNSSLAKKLNNSEKLWKITQLSLKSKKTQFHMLNLSQDASFVLADRTRFIAWAYKISSLVNLLPEIGGKLLLGDNSNSSDDNIVSSLMAGRHSLTNNINEIILRY